MGIWFGGDGHGCRIGILSSAFGSDPAGGKNLVNHSFLSNSGTGVFDVRGRKARVFEVPLSYQLRPMQDNPFGMKLLFPFTPPTVDFDVTNVEGVVFPEDIKVLSVNPGLELKFPVRPNWVLKPFGKVGLGREISEGESAFIYSLGLKTSYAFSFKRFDFTLGSGVTYDAYTPTDERQNDFANLRIGLEAICPLGTTLSGRATQAGAYAAYYYYFGKQKFEPISRTPIEIEHQIEMTFGVYDPIPIWFFKFRRIGLAYRFGDGLKAIRLIFGFPF